MKMKFPENIERSIKTLYLDNIEISADAGMDNRILGDALTAMEDAKKAAPAMVRPSIWRTIMKSRITKLAAAAAIVIAVLVGIYEIGGSASAFAEVVKPFLTARTAAFKVTINVEGGPTQTGEGMFMEPGRLRQTSPDGTVVITDLQQGRMLALIPSQKRAIVYELVNIQEDPGELNIFTEIRRRILEAKETEDESVEFLDEREIEGRNAIGYHVEKPGVDITVWADAETKIPIRLENIMGPTTYIMSDIIFDVELDESQFSVGIPEGYTVHTLQMDCSEPAEKDLIEMFRIWSDNMDGNLPSSLEMSALMEFVRYQQAKMKQQGREPSEQEMMEKMMGMQQTLMRMSRGAMFVQQLPADSDSHYVGKDVKFGDADTPIFWYRPEGLETYRVIYGDLTIKDVSPENLPK
jgi:outer membrane lipoprotein-sorting protein